MKNILHKKNHKNSSLQNIKYKILLLRIMLSCILNTFIINLSTTQKVLKLAYKIYLHMILL